MLARRLLRVFCALTLFSLGLATRRAEACSCRGSPSGLIESLRAARHSAITIYYGRVESLKGGECDHIADVQVLEVFKGMLNAGSRLVVPGGGCGDCTYPFEAGATYLVYAHRYSPAAVSLCSRTRKAAADDLELKWLRSGEEPLEPVALQRETVSCVACELDDVAPTLVGRVPGDDCNLGLRDDEALHALTRVGRSGPEASTIVRTRLGQALLAARSIIAISNFFKRHTTRPRNVAASV